MSGFANFVRWSMYCIMSAGVGVESVFWYLRGGAENDV